MNASFELFHFPLYQSSQIKTMVFEDFKCKKWVKNSKNYYILIFGFQCVAINIEGWSKICISPMVYNQFWLNLPRDYHHFLYIFLWINATLSYIKNFLKKECERMWKDFVKRSVESLHYAWSNEWLWELNPKWA